MQKKRFMHPDRKAKRRARRGKIGRGVMKIAKNKAVQGAVLAGGKQLLSGGLSKKNLGTAALAALGSTKKGNAAISGVNAVRGLLR